jgi:hypothetical protein
VTSRGMKDKGVVREGGNLADLEARPTGAPSKRAARKISEPLARAPRSAASATKTGARSATVKNKDKAKKPRRRS